MKKYIHINQHVINCQPSNCQPSNCQRSLKLSAVITLSNGGSKRVLGGTQ